MRFRMTLLPKPTFRHLAQAQAYLRETGWTPYHAGAWVHPQRPGVQRDIRQPGDVTTDFVFAEVSPVKEDEQ